MEGMAKCPSAWWKNHKLKPLSLTSLGGLHEAKWFASFTFVTCYNHRWASASLQWYFCPLFPLINLLSSSSGALWHPMHLCHPFSERIVTPHTRIAAQSQTLKTGSSISVLSSKEHFQATNYFFKLRGGQQDQHFFFTFPPWQEFPATAFFMTAVFRYWNKSSRLTTKFSFSLLANTYLYIPEPKLRTIIWATGNKVVVIWTPGNVGDPVCVTF